MRVSRLGDREEDDPRFISVKQQKERIEWWASGNDVTIRWYEETNVSGGDATRPKWNACIEACERGELRGIVVYNLSRWARRARDAQDAFDRLQAVGARFVSVQESFDDSTMMGRFARDIVLLIAQLDRERAIENWDAATRQAVEDGVHVAPTPFGYLRPKDAKVALGILKQLGDLRRWRCEAVAHVAEDGGRLLAGAGGKDLAGCGPDPSAAAISGRGRACRAGSARW